MKSKKKRAEEFQKNLCEFIIMEDRKHNYSHEEIFSCLLSRAVSESILLGMEKEEFIRIFSVLFEFLEKEKLKFDEEIFNSKSES